jgi:D-alanyl-D-alanine carboxypeptidase
MRHLVASLVFLLPATLRAQTLPSPAAVARIADSLGADFVASQRAPSVAVAIVRGRDTITIKAWGMADLENEVPATARSVYRIGSVTKQFTAAAVMQLAEQGKLRLDDSIAAHLNGLPRSWRRVTIRQLLNHTSGIPSYTDIGDRWRRRWSEEMTPESLLALTTADSMWFEPGARWRYDNTGYVLLGMLIEKLSGRAWGTDLIERFARPLGLTDTRSCQAEPIIPRRVRGYENEGKGWINTPYLAMSQPYAAGAMCSTVGDLARWNRALHSGKVVSAASYALMTTPEGAAAKNSFPYGFGLGRDTLGGQTVIVHGGGIHGFIAGNVWVPGADLSVTVLTNSGGAPVDELLKQLVRAALGVPLAQRPVVVALSGADRSRYVGVYALELPNGTRDFTVTIAGDQLTGQLAGQQAVPMLPFGNHVFGVGFDPNLRLVFTIEGAKASRVTLHQGGGTFQGLRK